MMIPAHEIRAGDHVQIGDEERIIEEVDCRYEGDTVTVRWVASDEEREYGHDSDVLGWDEEVGLLTRI